MPDQAKDKPKEEQKPLPKAKKAKKAKVQYFVKRFYIPGFGFVDHGDEASKEALVAWKKITKVPIDNYLADSPPVADLTDKEKLAEYEALKKK